MNQAHLASTYRLETCFGGFFMQFSSQEVIPFGKYKGQPLHVLMNDKAYLEWLTAQDWFRNRYSGIYQIVINNFSEPNDTPEHNKIHVKFLDNAYLHNTIRAIARHTNVREFKRDKFINRVLPKLFCISKYSYDHYRIDSNCYLETDNGWDVVFDATFNMSRQNVINLYNTELNNFLLSPVVQKDSYTGEVKYISYFHQDISTLDISEEHIYPSVYTDNRAVYLKRHSFYGEYDDKKTAMPEIYVSFLIEIKPTISDDFPSILRTMKSRISAVNEEKEKIPVLFVGEYTGIGASKEQFEKFFNSQGIYVIYESDVDSMNNKS